MEENWSAPRTSPIRRSSPSACRRGRHAQAARRLSSQYMKTHEVDHPAVGRPAVHPDCSSALTESSLGNRCTLGSHVAEAEVGPHGHGEVGKCFVDLAQLDTYLPVLPGSRV